MTFGFPIRLDQGRGQACLAGAGESQKPVMGLLSPRAFLNAPDKKSLIFLRLT